MKKREALAILRKEAETRLAAETLIEILAAAADTEDATDRLAALTDQIAGAERTLASVRERIQREDREGRERMAEVSRQIAAAEIEAAQTVSQFGREAVQRIDAAREATKAELATFKRETETEVARLKAASEGARLTHAALLAKLEVARRELAPLMGGT